jgi:predicted phage tail protein
VQGIAVLNNAGPHVSAPGCFQDALTHVLGHTVGLGDTDSVGARMRPDLAGDCAAGGHGLGADDVSGLRSIYPAVPSGGAPPLAPTAVTYTEAGGTVTVNWTPAVTGGPASSYIIHAGTAPGLSNVAVVSVPAPTTSIVAPGVPPGVYYLRVFARNVLGTSGPSPERAVIVGPCAVPNTPATLSSTVVDQFVTVNWAPPAGGGVSTYQLSVGSAPGLSDVLVLPLPASSLSVSGIAGYGTYYARIAAANACGVSAPTPDISISVQPCAGPPNAPTNLTFARNGNQVSFAWNAPASGPLPSQYGIAAGSAPGLMDIAAFATGNLATSLSASAPPGTYYVRVVALNACGISAFTNEVQVVIP